MTEGKSCIWCIHHDMCIWSRKVSEGFELWRRDGLDTTECEGDNSTTHEYEQKVRALGNKVRWKILANLAEKCIGYMKDSDWD